MNTDLPAFALVRSSTHLGSRLGEGNVTGPSRSKAAKLLSLLMVGLCCVGLSVTSNVANAAPSVAYITEPGAPFDGQTGNIIAMDSVFGTGNWSPLNFDNAVGAGIFTPGDYRFLFVAGNHGSEPTRFQNFINANRTQLESWVGNGGRLFLDAWQPATSFDLGFGARLNEQPTVTGTASVPSHPIFNGPFGATGNAWNGSSFAHSSVTVSSDFRPLITGSAGQVVLAERDYGNGHVMVGGMTLPYFQTHELWGPRPEISYLQTNILSYTARQQPVVFAWGEDAPFSFVRVQSASGDISLIEDRCGNGPPGTMTAAAVAPDDQAQLIDEVRSIFLRAGVSGLTFTSGPSRPDAVNVHLVQDGPDTPRGWALAPDAWYADCNETDILGQFDRFNRDPHGVTSVEFSGDILKDAQVVAHEIAHTLGMRHVLGGSSPEIMSYVDVYNKSFTNGPFNVMEPPGSGGTVKTTTHNPVYYLRHVVNGETPSALAVEHIFPGSWDLPQSIIEEDVVTINMSLVGGIDPMLFDIFVLGDSADVDDEGRTIVLRHDAEARVSDLISQAYSLPTIGTISLTASSTPGGPHDVVLSLGNPLVPSDFRIPLDYGNFPIYLLRKSPTGADYTTLAHGSIDIAVAEPQAASLMIIGIIGLVGIAIYARRRMPLALPAKPSRSGTPCLTVV